jgi:hypothetical protein
VRSSVPIDQRCSSADHADPIIGPASLAGAWLLDQAKPLFVDASRPALASDALVGARPPRSVLRCVGLTDVRSIFRSAWAVRRRAVRPIEALSDGAVVDPWAERIATEGNSPVRFQ